MKLTWGEPFWPARDPSPLDHPALDGDANCDVLVVGAGISGALVADALVAAGLDVIVADKREPGRGSTAASTALLLYELDTPLHELIGMVGRDRAERAYRLGAEAIDRAGQLVAELGGDCGLTRRMSIYLASRRGDVAALKEETELRRRIGLRVEFLSEEDLAARFPFRQAGAILSHDAAELDPYQLTRQVLARAVRRGLRLYSHTDVKHYECQGDGIVAVTHNGPQVRARHIVFATGYEAAGAHGGGIATAQATYAIASQPLDSFPGWWERCLLWETARPYLYLRTTPDGRALIGGEDDGHVQSAGDRNHLDRKRRTLETRFAQLFPEIRLEADAVWAGVFETTADGLPFIGPRPGHPGALFALGYGGNGITFSLIAADILRDLVIGKHNGDAEVFTFERGGAV